MGDSLRLGEFKSEARGFRRNPVGIRDRSNYVSAAWRMLLFDLTEMGAREPVGKTNQCWPEPSMDKCDLATYDAANKNIIVVSHRAGQCEYLFALGVGPPTSLERSLRHRLCKGGNRPSTRLQHDTVFSNKFEGLVGGHLWPHWLPEGNLSVFVGRHGAMNPAGRVRYNIMAIAKGYSCASRGVFF